MNVIFATKNRREALERLQKALPQYSVTEENAKEVLDLVSNGQIRVGDPMMYGNVPLFPEKGCDIPKAKEICNNFMKILQEQELDE